MFGTSVSELLWMSNSVSIVAFIYILVSSIITIVLIKKKGTGIATVGALTMGVIGAVIFLSIWQAQGALADSFYLTQADLAQAGAFYGSGHVVGDVVTIGTGADAVTHVITAGDLAAPGDYASLASQINPSTGELYKAGDLVTTDNLGNALNPWSEEVKNWLDLFPIIFLSLIQLMVVPFVFITMIWLVSVKSKESNMSSKSFIRSAGWLAVAEIIGIAVGFAMLPIIKIAVDPSLFQGAQADAEAFTSVWGIILGWFPESWDSLLVGTSAVISLMFLGIAIGFSLRKLDDNGNETAADAARFVDLFHKMFTQLIKWILYLLPFVIFSKIPALSFGDAASAWASLGIIIGITFLGMAVMFGIQLMIMIGTKGPSFTYKWFKGFRIPAITALSTRSSIASLPQNQDNLINAGIDIDVATTVPTLNTSMGLSTCAGMYPTIISLFALTYAGQQGAEITWLSYVMVAIVIFMTSFGVAGVPGAFEATGITAITTMGFGAYTTIIATVAVLEPILDPFRTITNMSGGNMAAFRMDAYHEKTKKLARSTKDDILIADDREEVVFEHIDPKSIHKDEFDLDHIALEEAENKEIKPTTMKKDKVVRSKVDASKIRNTKSTKKSKK